jgi:hypothetical protein
MRGKKGFVQVIAVLVMVIAIVIIVWAAFPRGQAVIEVDASINPQSFKSSKQSVLALTFKNNDQASAHSIRLRFVTYYLVHVYLGTQELTSEVTDSGNYTFDFVLQPAQKTEQPFVIKVSALPMGIASQEFSMIVEVYDDGKLATTQRVTFKVEEG